MDKNRRVAVVGSGISGTIAAWLLRTEPDVRLFEADTRFGGHTNTAFIDDLDGRIPIDTGFMVFNRENYPLLSALFEHLGVAAYPTDMSFSASFDNGRLEYAGTNLDTLFGQRRNLISGRFWGLLWSIVRFNRAAQRALRMPPAAEISLGDFLDCGGFDERFRAQYLYPMAAAIWSCPRGQIARFPALSFLRFFANHGLIRLADRPQWLTVKGGASTYINRLVADLGERAVTGAHVARIERNREQVTLIFADGRREAFDDIVLACHSDQSLALLADPSPSERQILSAIPYQANRVFLHRDSDLMPRARRVWSSWNYLSEPADDASRAVSVTYWMNSLQRLHTRQDYFVSLNPLRDPRAETIVDYYEYHHPIFDAAALAAQKQLHRIQGRARTWFAGAWTGYGFHEDGMRSGVEVAQALGASIPWASEAQASRNLTLIPQLVGQAA
ncbi:MAG: FAD-dependent oxidoreductase [Sedimenticolaceae bacterium]